MSNNPWNLPVDKPWITKSEPVVARPKLGKPWDVPLTPRARSVKNSVGKLWTK